MDKNIRNLYIIGFPKCGSSSLRLYLRMRFPQCEVASFPGQSLYHSEWNPARFLDRIVQSFIIIRDPYERTWSAYWWSRKYIPKHIPMPTFENFLKHGLDHHSAHTSGTDNPIQACDYWKYIKKAESLKPIILRFEDMIKLKNFPNVAKTAEVVKIATGIDIVKPPLDAENRKLIKEALIKEGISDKY